MKQPQKRIIHFHGVFKEKYQEAPLEIYADSMFNLFNILFKGVYPELLEEKDTLGIAFETKDGEYTDLFDPEQELSPEQVNIHIYPSADGAYAQIVIQIILMIVAIGISLLLAPKMENNQDTTSGANWETPENVVGQGGTIPVVLGTRLVGSRVASYGIDSTIFKKSI